MENLQLQERPEWGDGQQDVRKDGVGSEEQGRGVSTDVRNPTGVQGKTGYMQAFIEEVRVLVSNASPS